VTIIAMFFIVLTVVTTNPLNISVDWAAFNYTNSFALVEVYYSCPYNLLQYTVRNETIIAPYQIKFRLKSLEGSDSIIDFSNHRAIISSFENAEHRDLKLIDGFGFFARAGRYHFNFTILESLPIASFNDTVEVPPFTKSPSLSNIELASSVKADSSGGKFIKGNMRIIPNPDLNYGQAYQLLYAYIEGYNLQKDTLPYELSYRILSENQSVIKSFPAEVKQKIGTDFAYTFALSIKGLKPGNYYLEIKLIDRTNNNEDTQIKAFSVLSPIIEQTGALHDQTVVDTSSYAKEIQFFATPTELSQYNSLNELGKKAFLRKFWQKYSLTDFISRVKYADEKYGLGRLAGRETDRGRIYIKYGQPDEVVIHTMIEHTKPHEHWYYYSKGFQYIFIDIHSNNNFLLIYSNNDAETKNSSLEKYVDPIELDDLR